MSSETQTTERYASAVGELWSRVTPALARLDGIAAQPEALDDDELMPALRRLQYSLHLAVERAYGFVPPPGAATAHAELAAALAAARDATAEVGEAVSEHGTAGLARYLYEWRGALFRVRLARMRVAAPAPSPLERSGRHVLAEPLAAVALVFAGAGLFVAGALLSLWPLWSVGVVAVTVSAALHRS